MAAVRNHPLPNDEDEPNVEREVVCPRCKGTGLDRWEEEDCDTCFGDGSVMESGPIIRVRT